jgi:hypothetical protein
MADPVRQHKLVIIQESMLDGMAADNRFANELPFLRGLLQLPRKPRCGSCSGGTASAVRQQAYAAAKRTLAGLSSDKKRKLKELLNTKHARVVFKTDSGKITELTF